MKIKEATLNGLLIALVTMSLVLSSRLWLGSPEEALPLTTQLPTISPAPSPPILGSALDFTAPESIALVDGPHALEAIPGTNVYDQLWFAVQPVLGKLGRPSLPYPLEVEEGALRPLFNQGPTLVVNLPLTLTLGDWSTKWWGARAEPAPVAQSQVNRLIFFLNAPARVVFYGPSSARDLFLNAAERSALLDTVADVRTTYEKRFTSQLYVPKQGELQAELGVTIPAKPDGVTQALVRTFQSDAPDFAARFFPDMSVVRQVIDSEQSTIFTDGVRLLRLYRYGEVEYVAADPGDKTVPDLKKALAIATDFVVAHGGFPEYVQLTDVRAVGGHLRLNFGRKAGPTPLLALSKPLIEVELVGERVVRYSRLPNYLVDSRTNPVPAVSAEDAMRIVIQNVDGANLETVHTISRADVLTQGSDRLARACWVLWLTFRTEPIYVDMVTGKIVERR